MSYVKLFDIPFVTEQENPVRQVTAMMALINRPVDLFGFITLMELEDTVQHRASTIRDMQNNNLIRNYSPYLSSPFHQEQPIVHTGPGIDEIIDSDSVVSAIYSKGTKDNLRGFIPLAEMALPDLTVVEWLNHPLLQCIISECRLEVFVALIGKKRWKERLHDAVESIAGNNGGTPDERLLHKLQSGWLHPLLSFTSVSSRPYSFDLCNEYNEARAILDCPGESLYSRREELLNELAIIQTEIASSNK